MFCACIRVMVEGTKFAGRQRMEHIDMSLSRSEMTREYECEYYKVKAHPRSCFFCYNCTEIFFDYTNGPYMFICDVKCDTHDGLLGLCKQFSEMDV